MSHNLFETRAIYSRDRLDQLRNRFAKLNELKAFPDLTIFAAGSYGRLEASKYSDIDLFFLCNGNGESHTDPRTNCHRIFGKIIDIADEMSLPKFSNDAEYLTLLHTDKILESLGGRADDHENYFTARMLLLLESRCLYGDDNYSKITAKIVDSYFSDFPDHKNTFMPMFLMNDICRFWKTLLLNYENKRKQSDDESRKTKQKVRNFKLKFSRMTTCFASVAALGSYSAPVSPEQVISVASMTPQERLSSVAERVPTTKDAVEEVLRRYHWFLEMTGHPTEELEGHFSDKAKRTEMFKTAGEYGDAMFALLRAIDNTDPRLRLFRNLVI